MVKFGRAYWRDGFIFSEVMVTKTFLFIGFFVFIGISRMFISRCDFSCCTISDLSYIVTYWCGEIDVNAKFRILLWVFHDLHLFWFKSYVIWEGLGSKNINVYGLVGKKFIRIFPIQDIIWEGCISLRYYTIFIRIDWTSKDDSKCNMLYWIWNGLDNFLDFCMPVEIRPDTSAHVERVQLKIYTFLSFSGMLQK